MFCGHDIPPLMDPRSRRLGRLMVSYTLLEEFPRLVREMFAEILILEASYDPVRDVITYVGTSEHFAKTQEGEIVTYTAEFHAGRVRFRV